MTRSLASIVLACAIPLLAGCEMPQASGPQFVAANSSTVIVDYTRTADLEQARELANQKCGLFGSPGGVLESLNVAANGRERASFLCR